MAHIENKTARLIHFNTKSGLVSCPPGTTQVDDKHVPEIQAELDDGYRPFVESRELALVKNVDAKAEAEAKAKADKK